MWLKMGEELELEVLPKGCTPPPPSPDYHSTLSTFGTKNESLKRPLSPTPESDAFSPVASYSPALDSCSAFTPVTRTISQAEDSILTTLRRTNQDKIQKLEKRMKEKTQEDVLLEQVNVLKTLLARVTVDVDQMKIIINFLEDKLSKGDNRTSAKRVAFTTL
ncbi:uncharacterized protein LOC128186368 [Crassostrea angulata]|uniref:uncharacterized protein LOC128186368 n=1 Tax=Magallana angulata TaxID=2784310 RepID=UPI0022B08957|nr:uncharacterized protein LOC128186368 [Crassostrea angulata]